MVWYLDKIRPLFTNETEGPLFLSERRVRLNKHTARMKLMRKQEKIGFTKEEFFRPHQLRHSFATRQTEVGVDLLTLKELLGHADVATTFNYSNPVNCLLTTLCFYHGLSSSHIRNIKLSDINVDRKAILINDRPPVYLSNDELFLINA